MICATARRYGSHQRPQWQMSDQSRVAVMTGGNLLAQGFLHLDPGNTRIGNSRSSLRIENQIAAGGQMEMSDGCGRLALFACEENSPLILSEMLDAQVAR